MEVPLSEQVRTQVLLAGQRVATSETDSERSARTSFPKVEGTVNKLEIQSFSSHGCVLLRAAPAEWHRVVWGPLEQTQLPLIKAGVGRGPQAGKKELLCTYGQGYAGSPSPPMSVAVFLA